MGSSLFICGARTRDFMARPKSWPGGRLACAGQHSRRLAQTAGRANLVVSRCLILLVLLLLELGHLVLVREEVVMLVLVVTGWWGVRRSKVSSTPDVPADGRGAQHGGAEGRRTYQEEALKDLHPLDFGVLRVPEY